jgi:hypothetical protein
MDTTLVTVTVLSMGMAAALSVIVWRLLRDERHRSEARVVALTAAATLSPSPRVSATRDGGVDLPLHAGEKPVVTNALFVEPVRSSPWGNRLAVMAGLALVGASLLFVVLTATRTRAAAPAASTTAQVTAPAAVGLELLSLRDARQADTLTITGMVQNPRTGSLLSRVAVTAYAFDDKGAFLASGRALLDVTTLAPGDESPFVVTVPVSDAVARYRIGFRGEDGRVIAHVDRRQPSPIAALQVRSGRAH